MYTWNPPSHQEGSIYFVATVVENYSGWRENVKSYNIPPDDGSNTAGPATSPAQSGISSTLPQSTSSMSRHARSVSRLSTPTQQTTGRSAVSRSDLTNGGVALHSLCSVYLLNIVI